MSDLKTKNNLSNINKTKDQLMIKFGVTDKKELFKPSRHIGRMKKNSIPLILSQLETDPNSEATNQIFNEVVVGGTYKKTKENRFSQINKQILNVIDNYYKDGPKSPLIHDLAVSSGLTSIEFYESIDSLDFDFNFVASDFFTHIYIVKMKSSSWNVVLDSSMNLLQYVGSRFVLSEPESQYDLVNIIILKMLNTKLLAKAQNFVRNQIENSDDYQYLETKVERGTIIRKPLIHPLCITKVDNCSNFQFIRHDLFKKTRQQFDIIRAMNILNLCYFPDRRIKEAVLSIFKSFTDNGIFIVGRSNDESDGQTKTTIFEKCETGFRVIEDIDGGSEIKDLILNMF